MWLFQLDSIATVQPPRLKDTKKRYEFLNLYQKDLSACGHARAKKNLLTNLLLKNGIKRILL